MNEGEIKKIIVDTIERWNQKGTKDGKIVSLGFILTEYKHFMADEIVEKIKETELSDYSDSDLPDATEEGDR